MYEEEFCKRLAQLRMERGISAREMSLSMGQGPAYINNIENRRRMPSMTGFFYICEYFGISPREFWDTDITSPTESRLLLADFNQLSDKKQELVRGFVRELRR